MTPKSGPNVIVVTAFEGQPSVEQLSREAALGLRPRKDYVELAGLIGADVVDAHHVQRRASRPIQLVAETAGYERAQIMDVARLARGAEHVIAWGDRLGMQLATLFKATRGRDDLIMVSHWLSLPKRVRFFRLTRFDTHLRAIINYSSRQLEFARELGAPVGKLALFLQPVDERFWASSERSHERRICVVGSEARDIPTLISAVDGMDVEAELALGTVAGSGRGLPGTMLGFGRRTLPAGVTIHHHLDPVELRALYARSALAVVPLRDVEFDAGVTAITEAMSMRLPVIVTRTRGQVDIVEHGRQGLYVPPGDPVALRATIDELLRSRTRASAMGEEGRVLVERRHTLDHYVERFAELVTGS